VVQLTLVRRGAPARADTVTLRFAAGARVSESPGLPAGVYDVRAPGGAAVLAVNASAELLPRRPTVVAGPVGGGAPTAGEAPRVRDSGWPYAAAALVFCAEWVLRRRRGLR
jgi:hypothetical protein